MALLAPDAGEVECLKRMLNYSAADNCKLKLYTNNYTPVEGSVVGGFTEATASGYSAKTLTGTSWTIGTASNVTTATYSAQTFTFSTAATCYGYYVTNSGGSICLWAEKFASAYAIPSGGGSITITPTITLD
jgi:hypothetical protein